MTMQRLSERLDDAQSDLPDADVMILNWKSRVSGLCGEIEAWLQPLRASGKLKVDYREDLTTEIGLGTYSTKGLGLRFSRIPGEIRVEAKSALVAGVLLPGGNWRTGVCGRVDLGYGAMRIPIALLREGSWAIALDDELEPLTELSFERALLDLMG